MSNENAFHGEYGGLTRDEFLKLPPEERLRRHNEHYAHSPRSLLEKRVAEMERKRLDLDAARERRQLAASGYERLAAEITKLPDDVRQSIRALTLECLDASIKAKEEELKTLAGGLADGN